VNIYQRGNQLLWDNTPVADTITTNRPITPFLATVKHHYGAPLLMHLVDKSSATQTLPVSGSLSLRDSNKTLILQSTLAQLWFTLRDSNAFYWAHSLSITVNGVVASTDTVRVSWPADRPPTAAMADSNGAMITVLDDAPEWLHRYPPQLDEYGLFVTITLASLSFTLRYIPPGPIFNGLARDRSRAG
jgi:hypothetical protein